MVVVAGRKTGDEIRTAILGPVYVHVNNTSDKSRSSSWISLWCRSGDESLFVYQTSSAVI